MTRTIVTINATMVVKDINGIERTIEKLVNKTKEHYEFAMEMGDVYSIASVIKGYQTFTNLYGLDMITTKTFDKYFNNLYTMANNVYNQYIHDNEEMNKNVKTILSIPFVE